MATPDSVTEHFDDTTETVEVRGDFVVLTIETRFGEPLLEDSLSVEEALALADRLFSAATTIYRRQPHEQPDPTYGDPCPPGFHEVDTEAEGFLPGDFFDVSTGKTYREADPWVDAAAKVAQ